MHEPLHGLSSGKTERSHAWATPLHGLACGKRRPLHYLSGVFKTVRCTWFQQQSVHRIFVHTGQDVAGCQEQNDHFMLKQARCRVLGHKVPGLRHLYKPIRSKINQDLNNSKKKIDTTIGKIICFYWSCYKLVQIIGLTDSYISPCWGHNKELL